MNHGYLVTTSHRGVFFGRIDDYQVGQDPIILREAQMATYWPEATRGVFGLASAGPLDGARIGAPAGDTELRDITSVTPVSAEAAERWRAAPWS